MRTTHVKIYEVRADAPVASINDATRALADLIDDGFEIVTCTAVEQQLVYTLVKRDIRDAIRAKQDRTDDRRT